MIRISFFSVKSSTINDYKNLSNTELIMEQKRGSITSSSLELLESFKLFEQFRDESIITESAIW